MSRNLYSVTILFGVIKIEGFLISLSFFSVVNAIIAKLEDIQNIPHFQ